MQPLAPARLPQLTLLLAFKTVAEQGSFTRAARILHLSQSAVSQQIVKLEEALDAQLFIRSTRLVTLTVAGRNLLDETSGPFDDLVKAFDRCARTQDRLSLHIETEPVLSAFWLTPRLREFTKNFINLDLEQTLSSKRVEFSGDIDLAIKWGKADWPGFQSEYLLGLDYVPVCSPLLLEGRYSLSDPANMIYHPLLHDRSVDDWVNWGRAYPDVPIKTEGGHIVSDSNVLTELAIEGHGVALCGLELIQRPLRNGDLVIPFPDMMMRHPLGYYLLTRKTQRLSDVALQFVEWVKKQAQLTENQHSR
ncbi:LysR substrate-binding domain-containing protein [Pseudomonas sp.]|uniref:LysR substrate-binding domain-containing protein n=1 Tax=Pseudomonas sp. TaxID=306 RepID=UPI0025908BDD|nr:LysR substrate-binding domain-containing protein [Pseudomonas sp.]